MKDPAPIEYSWDNGEMAILNQITGDTRTLEHDEEQEVVETYPLIDLSTPQGSVYVEQGDLEERLLHK